MSRFHYIGSATELPLGERGSVPSAKTYNEVKNSPEYKKHREALRLQGIIPLDDIADLSHLRDENCLVYDSEEDAAGIFIEELVYWNDEIRKHFRSTYVYRISPNWGGFSVSPKLKDTLPGSYNASLKCCRELFRLMTDYGVSGAEFELYTCWAEEEGLPRNKKYDRIFDLASLSLEDGFELREKEYIVVKMI